MIWLTGYACICADVRPMILDFCRSACIYRNVAAADCMCLNCKNGIPCRTTSMQAACDTLNVLHVALACETVGGPLMVGI
jgi:hypothetical protein